MPSLLGLVEESSKSQVNGSSNKSWDQYWQATGLTSKEIEKILSSESCYANSKNLLGCVNAISAMAERYQLTLDKNSLNLVSINSEEVDQRLTEKLQLQKWQNQFLSGSGIISQASEIKSENQLIPFLKLWQNLDKKYVRSSERSAVVAAGINAFLSLTRDPHSYLIPLDFYDEMIARSDLQPQHPGFTAKRVLGAAYVRKIFEGSPAHLAGLKKGDQITAINGQSVLKMGFQSFNDALKLKTGQRIFLNVQRKEQYGSSEKTINLDFEIAKTDQTFANVLGKFANEEKRLGLITIHRFSKKTCEQTRKEIISLKEQGMRGLILDLRDNPGGQVDEAACVLNLFVEKGTPLFETRYLDVSKPTEKYFAENKRIYTGALTVLINGGSASASEIVAGSLKDLGRAQLVGEKSFGKGSFQDGRIWGGNNKVAYFQTEGLYYFPSGWTPQLIGLDPDIKVDSLEGKTLREEDLYLNPLRPNDLWVGPQSLAWLGQVGCQQDDVLEQNDDTQIAAAIQSLTCNSKGLEHANNRSL